MAAHSPPFLALVAVVALLAIGSGHAGMDLILPSLGNPSVQVQEHKLLVQRPSEVEPRLFFKPEPDFSSRDVHLLVRRLLAADTVRENLVNIFGQILSSPFKDKAPQAYSALEELQEALRLRKVDVSAMLPSLKQVAQADLQTQLKEVFQSMMNHVPASLRCTVGVVSDALNNNTLDVGQIRPQDPQHVSINIFVGVPRSDISILDINPISVQKQNTTTDPMFGRDISIILEGLKNNNIPLSPEILVILIRGRQIAHVSPDLEELERLLVAYLLGGEVPPFDSIIGRITEADYLNPYNLISKILHLLLQNVEVPFNIRVVIKGLLPYLVRPPPTSSDQLEQKWGLDIDSIIYSVINANDPEYLVHLGERIKFYIDHGYVNVTNAIKDFPRYEYRRPIDILIALLTRIAHTGEHLPKEILSAIRSFIINLKIKDFTDSHSEIPVNKLDIISLLQEFLDITLPENVQQVALKLIEAFVREFVSFDLIMRGQPVTACRTPILCFLNFGRIVIKTGVPINKSTLVLLIELLNMFDEDGNLLPNAINEQEPFCKPIQPKGRRYIYPDLLPRFPKYQKVYSLIYRGKRISVPYVAGLGEIPGLHYASVEDREPHYEKIVHESGVNKLPVLPPLLHHLNDNRDSNILKVITLTGYPGRAIHGDMFENLLSVGRDVISGFGNAFNTFLNAFDGGYDNEFNYSPFLYPYQRGVPSKLQIFGRKSPRPAPLPKEPGTVMPGIYFNAVTGGEQVVLANTDFCSHDQNFVITFPYFEPSNQEADPNDPLSLLPYTVPGSPEDKTLAPLRLLFSHPKLCELLSGKPCSYQNKLTKDFLLRFILRQALEVPVIFNNKLLSTIISQLLVVLGPELPHLNLDQKVDLTYGVNLFSILPTVQDGSPQSQVINDLITLITKYESDEWNSQDYPIRGELYLKILYDLRTKEDVVRSARLSKLIFNLIIKEEDDPDREVSWVVPDPSKLKIPVDLKNLWDSLSILISNSRDDPLREILLLLRTIPILDLVPNKVLPFDHHPTLGEVLYYLLGRLLLNPSWVPDHKLLITIYWYIRHLGPHNIPQKLVYPYLLPWEVLEVPNYNDPASWLPGTDGGSVEEITILPIITLFRDPSFWHIVGDDFEPHSYKDRGTLLRAVLEALLTKTYVLSNPLLEDRIRGLLLALKPFTVPQYTGGEGKEPADTRNYTLNLPTLGRDPRLLELVQFLQNPEVQFLISSIKVPPTKEEYFLNILRILQGIKYLPKSIIRIIQAYLHPEYKPIFTLPGPDLWNATANVWNPWEIFWYIKWGTDEFNTLEPIIALFRDPHYLYEILGVYFDPYKYPTNGELLVAILTRLLEVPQVIEDRKLYNLIEMYLKFLVPDWSLLPITTWIKTPVNQTDSNPGSLIPDDVISLRNIKMILELIGSYERLGIDVSRYHNQLDLLLAVLQAVMSLDEVKNNLPLYYRIHDIIVFLLPWAGMTTEEPVTTSTTTTTTTEPTTTTTTTTEPTTTTTTTTEPTTTTTTTTEPTTTTTTTTEPTTTTTTTTEPTTTTYTTTEPTTTTTTTTEPTTTTTTTTEPTTTTTTTTEPTTTTSTTTEPTTTTTTTTEPTTTTTTTTEPTTTTTTTTEPTTTTTTTTEPTTTTTTTTEPTTTTTTTTEPTTTTTTTTEPTTTTTTTTEPTTTTTTTTEPTTTTTTTTEPTTTTTTTTEPTTTTTTTTEPTTTTTTTTEPTTTTTLRPNIDSIIINISIYDQGSQSIPELFNITTSDVPSQKLINMLIEFILEHPEVLHGYDLRTDGIKLYQLINVLTLLLQYHELPYDLHAFITLWLQRLDPRVPFLSEAQLEVSFNPYNLTSVIPVTWDDTQGNENMMQIIILLNDPKVVKILGDLSNLPNRYLALQYILSRLLTLPEVVENPVLYAIVMKLYGQVYTDLPVAPWQILIEKPDRDPTEYLPKFEKDSPAAWAMGILLNVLGRHDLYDILGVDFNPKDYSTRYELLTAILFKLLDTYEIQEKPEVSYVIRLYLSRLAPQFPLFDGTEAMKRPGPGFISLLPFTDNGSVERETIKPIIYLLLRPDILRRLQSFHIRAPTKMEALPLLLKKLLTLPEVHTTDVYQLIQEYIDFLEPKFPIFPIEEGVEPPEYKEPTLYLPYTEVGSPEWKSVKLIWFFLNNDNVYQKLGRNWNPESFPTKDTLLVGVLEHMLDLPEVKGDKYLYRVIVKYLDVLDPKYPIPEPEEGQKRSNPYNPVSVIPRPKFGTREFTAIYPLLSYLLRVKDANKVLGINFQPQLYPTVETMLKAVLNKMSVAQEVVINTELYLNILNYIYALTPAYPIPSPQEMIEPSNPKDPASAIPSPEPGTREYTSIKYILSLLKRFPLEKLVSSEFKAQNYPTVHSMLNQLLKEMSRNNVVLQDPRLSKNIHDYWIKVYPRYPIPSYDEQARKPDYLHLESVIPHPVPGSPEYESIKPLLNFLKTYPDLETTLGPQFNPRDYPTVGSLLSAVLKRLKDLSEGIHYPDLMSTVSAYLDRLEPKYPLHTDEEGSEKPDPDVAKAVPETRPGTPEWNAIIDIFDFLLRPDIKDMIGVDFLPEKFSTKRAYLQALLNRLLKLRPVISDEELYRKIQQYLSLFAASLPELSDDKKQTPAKVDNPADNFPKPTKGTPEWYLLEPFIIFISREDIKLLLKPLLSRDMTKLDAMKVILSYLIDNAKQLQIPTDLYYFILRYIDQIDPRPLTPKRDPPPKDPVQLFIFNEKDPFYVQVVGNFIRTLNISSVISHYDPQNFPTVDDAITYILEMLSDLPSVRQDPEIRLAVLTYLAQLDPRFPPFDPEHWTKVPDPHNIYLVIQPPLKGSIEELTLKPLIELLKRPNILTLLGPDFQIRNHPTNVHLLRDVLLRLVDIDFVRKDRNLIRIIQLYVKYLASSVETTSTTTTTKRPSSHIGDPYPFGNTAPDPEYLPFPQLDIEFENSDPNFEDLSLCLKVPSESDPSYQRLLPIIKLLNDPNLRNYLGSDFDPLAYFTNFQMRYDILARLLKYGPVTKDFNLYNRIVRYINYLVSHQPPQKNIKLTLGELTRALPYPKNDEERRMVKFIRDYLNDEERLKDSRLLEIKNYKTFGTVLQFLLEKISNFDEISPDLRRAVNYYMGRVKLTGIGSKEIHITVIITSGLIRPSDWLYALPRTLNWQEQMMFELLKRYLQNPYLLQDPRLSEISRYQTTGTALQFLLNKIIGFNDVSSELRRAAAYFILKIDFYGRGSAPVNWPTQTQPTNTVRPPSKLGDSYPFGNTAPDPEYPQFPRLDIEFENRDPNFEDLSLCLKVPSKSDPAYQRLLPIIKLLNDPNLRNYLGSDFDPLAYFTNFQMRYDILARLLKYGPVTKDFNLYNRIVRYINYLVSNQPPQKNIKLTLGELTRALPYPKNDEERRMVKLIRDYLNNEERLKDSRLLEIKNYKTFGTVLQFLLEKISNFDEISTNLRRAVNYYMGRVKLTGIGSKEIHITIIITSGLIRPSDWLDTLPRTSNWQEQMMFELLKRYLQNPYLLQDPRLSEISRYQTTGTALQFLLNKIIGFNDVSSELRRAAAYFILKIDFYGRGSAPVNWPTQTQPATTVRPPSNIGDSYPFGNTAPDPEYLQFPRLDIEFENRDPNFEDLSLCLKVPSKSDPAYQRLLPIIKLLNDPNLRNYLGSDFDPLAYFTNFQMRYDILARLLKYGPVTNDFNLYNRIVRYINYLVNNQPPQKNIKLTLGELTRALHYPKNDEERRMVKLIRDYLNNEERLKDSRLLEIANYRTFGTVLQFLLDKISKFDEISPDLRRAVNYYMGRVKLTGIGNKEIHITVQRPTQQDIQLTDILQALPEPKSRQEHYMWNLIKEYLSDPYLTKDSRLSGLENYGTFGTVLQFLLNKISQFEEISPDLRQALLYYRGKVMLSGIGATRVIINSYIPPPRSFQFIDLLQALPKPKNRGEFNMMSLLQRYFSRPEELLSKVGTDAEKQKTYGQLLQYLLRRMASLDEVIEDAELYNAVLYYINKVLMTGPGRQNINIETHRNYDYNLILKAIGSVPPSVIKDIDNVVAYLNSNRDLRPILQGFDANRYSTNGQLLRAVFEFARRSPNVPPSIRGSISKILPYVKTTGEGAIPIQSFNKF